MTSCQSNRLPDRKSASCRKRIQTAEHKITPIMNVEEIMASMERCGPRLCVIKYSFQFKAVYLNDLNKATLMYDLTESHVLILSTLLSLK